MGPRCQNDKEAYRLEAQRLIAGHPSIDVFAGTVADFIIDEVQGIAQRCEAFDCRRVPGS